MLVLPFCYQRRVLTGACIKRQRPTCRQHSIWRCAWSAEKGACEEGFLKMTRKRLCARPCSAFSAEQKRHSSALSQPFSPKWLKQEDGVCRRGLHARGSANPRYQPSDHLNCSACCSLLSDYPTVHRPVLNTLPQHHGSRPLGSCGLEGSTGAAMKMGK